MVGTLGISHVPAAATALLALSFLLAPRTPPKPRESAQQPCAQGDLTPRP
ncbi:hypothetical protein [Streptomyces sp. NPDC058045]